MPYNTLPLHGGLFRQRLVLRVMLKRKGVAELISCSSMAVPLYVCNSTFSSNDRLVNINIITPDYLNQEHWTQVRLLRPNEMNSNRCCNEQTREYVLCLLCTYSLPYWTVW